MSLYDEIYASLPTNSFRLNSAGTAFADALNRGNTLTGTQALTTSIVTGNSKSLAVKNANAVNFSTTVYNAKSTNKPFSLEAWYQPRYFSASTIAILSHNTEYDGLWADLDNIYFTVKFATDTVSVSWPLPDLSETYHIVGIYTPGKIQLYINGEMVSQKEITDAQLAQGIKNFASNNLYSGQSATAAQFAIVDGLATYSRALGDAEIYRHFKAGRDVMNASIVSGIFGGNSFDGSSRDVYAVKQWSSFSDWAAGLYSDVEFDSGYLTPIEDPANQTSRAGTWTGVYETSEAPVLYGVRVDWDGDGLFTVQASINEGTSWLTLTNGRPITGTFNFDPAGKNILIRVVFTGGVVSDASKVRKLTLTGYTSSNVYGSTLARRLVVNDSVSTNPVPNEPIEGNLRAGFETFGNAGVINIMPDVEVEDAKNIGTLEFWVKFNGTSTGKYVFDTRPSGGTAYLWADTGLWAFPSGTLYVNGVATTSGSVAATPDVWYHVVYVFATTSNVRADIQTGDKNIGLVSVYPTQLSAATAALLYSLYGDYPGSRLATDANPVTEGASAYRLYAYDWSISPAG